MKKAKVLLLVSSLVIGYGSPAIAQTQDIQGDSITEIQNSAISEKIFGNNIYSQISQGVNLFGINLDSYLTSVQDFFLERIAKQINLENPQLDIFFSVLNQHVLAGISSKLGDLFGVLGYPNPNEISEQVPEIIVNTETEPLEEFTTFGKKELAIAASKKMLTEAYLESRLGDKAQEQKKQQLVIVSDLANHSVTAATTANSQNVTQDVLKQVAMQNANQALINQAMYAELTQIEMNQNMSLNELSKISHNLDKKDWEDTVNSTASRVSLVQAITQFSSLFYPGE